MALSDKFLPSVDHEQIREFYDSVYYRDVNTASIASRHLQRLARKLVPWMDRRVLDVACGAGAWLRTVAAHGAIPAGADISRKAEEICRRALADAKLYCPAEQLPFADCEFDFISCLGALEHFLDPQAALREIARVAKPDARVLLLVPNGDFLSRRLGLYSGTHQAQVCEKDRSLEEWRVMFESAGLRVERRWRDLYVLSASWIFRGPCYGCPLRAGQALVLPLWPLLQYQVYHLCRVKHA